MSDSDPRQFPAPDDRHEKAIPGELPKRSLIPPLDSLQQTLLIVLLLACGLALSHPLADADLWGHVRYGQDALENGELPMTTTYSFTAIDYPWVNHENLSELILGFVAKTAGGAGLLIWKLGLGMVVFYLLIRYGLSACSGVVAICIVAMLVALNLTAAWTLRPQIVSYTLLAVMIGLLESAFRGWSGQWHMRRASHVPPGTSVRDALGYHSTRLKYLWAMPVVILLWTNAHGGFVAGYCILAAYLVLRTIEAYATCGMAANGIARRMVMSMIACGAVTLLNPYGLRLHTWLWNSLREPRPEITEWAAISTNRPDILLPFLLLLFITIVGLVFSRRRRDFTQLVLLSLVAWQSMVHARHIPFFAILVGFWLPTHIDSVLSRVRKESTAVSSIQPLSKLAHRLAWISVTGLVLAFSSALAFRTYDLRIDRNEFPVGAVQFMTDQNIDGRMVVTYNWAQYIIGVFGEDVPVAFDGRFRTCYPRDVVDMHMDFILGDHPQRRSRSSDPPFSPDRVLNHKRPELVLIDRNYLHAVDVMQRQSDWVLLYQDHVAQLWGWRGKYDTPKSPHFLPPKARWVSNRAQVGSVSWPAIPVPNENIAHWKSRSVQGDSPPHRTDAISVWRSAK